jgi:hypothetical protein
MCAAALLALTACSKKTETAAPATAPEAPKAAATITPPERRAGLWVQTMTADQMHQETRICIDASVEKQLKWFSQGAGPSSCEQSSVTPRMGGGWAFHSSCAMGRAGHIVSDGVATGDFNSHYTVDIDSTTTGSAMLQANGPHKMKIDAVWQGPCPAGMRPGDMMLPGGMTMNLVDMANGKAPMGPGGMDVAGRAMAGAMGRQPGGQ